MSEKSKGNAPKFYTADIRSRIISDPDIVLDDPDVLMAIAAAADVDLGERVYDMREVALSVLKARLDGQKATHTKVIAATYENHVGTQIMHRAVLALLEAENLDSVLSALRDTLPGILRIDAIRLVVEVANQSKLLGRDITGEAMGDVVVFCPEDSVRDYLSFDPGQVNGKAILRQVEHGASEIYGSVGAMIRSEALLCLSSQVLGIPQHAWSSRAQGASKGKDREKAESPWLLALASKDPEQFKPGMGTDLISFFGAALLRVLGRWLKG